MTIVSGSPPAQGSSQPLHTGVVDNDIENMHPSGAARLFHDEILQAAAAETTAVSAAVSAAAEQTTTGTGQSGNSVVGHLGNSAASATVTGQSHGMDVDVPSITAVQNHPPAHIHSCNCLA